MTRVSYAACYLKQVAEIRYGLGQPPPLSDDGVPIIRATNIDSGRIDATGMIYADLAVLPLDRAPLLRAGEILLVRSGAYTGDSAIVPDEYEGSAPGYDLRITVRDAVPQFVAWALLSELVLGQIELAKGRAAQPHLNAEDAGLLKIPMPPLHEQRRIADFLDTETARIDALIEAKSSLANLLIDQRQALVSEAITGALSGPPREGLPHRLFGNLPVDWHIVRLKYITAGPLSYGLGEAADENVLSHPRYIRTTDITEDGRLRDDTRRSVVPEIAREAMLLPGDILLTRSGATIGKSFLYRNSMEASCHAGYLIRLRPDPEAVTPQYVRYFMESGPYWAQIEMNGIQSTIPNFNAERYGAIEMPLPPQAEQDEIVAHVETITSRTAKAIRLARDQMDLLTEYRQALITAAVTGQLDEATLNGPRPVDDAVPVEVSS